MAECTVYRYQILSHMLDEAVPQSAESITFISENLAVWEDHNVQSLKNNLNKYTIFKTKQKIIKQNDFPFPNHTTY